MTEFEGRADGSTGRQNAVVATFVPLAEDMVDQRTRESEGRLQQRLALLENWLSHPRLTSFDCGRPGGAGTRLRNNLID